MTLEATLSLPLQEKMTVITGMARKHMGPSLLATQPANLLPFSDVTIRQCKLVLVSTRWFSFFMSIRPSVFTITQNFQYPQVQGHAQWYSKILRCIFESRARFAADA